MTVQVGKLTVRTAQRGAGRDAGFRVRSESLLRSLDLEPPGLPERSVLVVRRMELPPVDRSTAERTRAALAELRRVAARPSADPVGASANAVLFADQAELLTCLTADLVHGVARGRWYWQEIVPGAEARRAAALATAWLRDVRWLPASLARLPRPEACHAVTLLSPPETARVLRALLAAFEVEKWNLPRLPADALTAAGQSRTEPPWRRWLEATSLSPLAESLLGVALSLHYAPALVRTRSYTERLAAWQAAGDDTRWQSPSSGDAPPPGAPAARVASRELAESADAPSAGADPGTGRLASAPWADGAPVAETPTVLAADGGTSENLAAGPGGAPHGRILDRPGASAAPGSAGHPAQSPADREVVDHGTPTWAEQGIVTGLASLLFLVNFVGWLDDEEDTLLPAGWALVELLGRHLLGDQLDDFADDPLWDLLAELDGRRPGTPPAVEFRAADPLRLPQAWLRRWLPPRVSYVAHPRGERLVVRHPEAGFVAADVACPPGRLDEVCAAEAALLGSAEIIVAGPEAAAPAATPEHRFGQAVGAFVGWLLRSRDIGASSLATPGRVRVTGTHVDVVLGLQDVDLAVRVAGLDRDPGWVPVLGRIVLFHFLAAP